MLSTASKKAFNVNFNKKIKSKAPERRGKSAGYFSLAQISSLTLSDFAIDFVHLHIIILRIIP